MIVQWSPIFRVCLENQTEVVLKDGWSMDVKGKVSPVSGPRRRGSPVIQEVHCPLYHCSGGPVYSCSGCPLYSSGGPLYCCSGGPLYSCSGGPLNSSGGPLSTVLLFRRSPVQLFRRSTVQFRRSTDHCTVIQEVHCTVQEVH